MTTTNWRSLALTSMLAVTLAGCASLNTVHSEVSSYGQWPTGRPPGTYTIERLPSQQANPRQQAIEAAAAAGLQQAGFQAAPDAASADVVVQIGARITRTDIGPWNDPLWWRWGPAYWHHPGWYGHGWAWPPYYYDNPQFDREVALLIRDRSSGTPLYEARAASTGMTEGNDATMRAMFQAAMKDFPNAVPTPHDVGVSLGEQ